MMDVARAAGVSHQTVSRVINRPDSVRPETLARVQAAIKELGYRPNLAARALVTDSTRMIGVVTTGSGFQGPASTTSAIVGAARAAGYACLVASLPEADRAGLEGVLRFFVARGVDAVIAVASQHWAADALREIAAALPVVVVADGLEPTARMHVVSVDQDLGARLAVGHLLETGREQVVHLAGPQDWYDAEARVRGWRGALEDAGLAVPELLVGDWSPECGYALGRRLADEGLPHAVFCGNDLMALGLLAALRDAGVQVPGRVAVVGFDDIEGAAFLRPALTTVRQPFDELGRVCLEVALRALDGEAGSAHSIAPQLQVRASSGR